MGVKPKCAPTALERVNRSGLSTAALNVSATYELTRTMTLSAGARYEKRSSNIRFGDYDAYILSLTGSIEF